MLPLNKRKETLENARIKLKEHFVGLDTEIDRLFSMIEAWYLFPEIMDRPCIISLWGMTGVGKTDLVRRLVRLLNLQDKFLEMQADDPRLSWGIGSLLSGSDILPSDQSVLLLDEAQRAKTLDEKSNYIGNTFPDLWMLLSDGKFYCDSRRHLSLMEYYYSLIYSDDGENMGRPNKSGKAKRKSCGYFTRSYDAKLYMSRLQLNVPIETVMMWDKDKLIQEVEKALASEHKSEPVAFTRMLVFICGNLDSLYPEVIRRTPYLDADFAHKITKDIDIAQAKFCLGGLFAQEQIARFGNNYILYPSLDRNAYKELIVKNVDDMLSRFKQKTGLSVIADDTVYSSIYYNSVSPAQGVRPIISDINAIIGNTLPKIFLDMGKEKQTITMGIEKNEQMLICTGSTVHKYPIYLERINKEQKMSADAKTTVAVHEAGHAVAAYLLYGTVPPQVSIFSAGDGVCFAENESNDKESFLDRIRTSLAGSAAEELVFKTRYMGSSSDISNATSVAARLVRRESMDVFSSYITTDASHIAEDCNLNIAQTNARIEAILQDCRKDVMKLLGSNKKLLCAISDALFEQHTLDQSALESILKRMKVTARKQGKDSDVYKAFKKKACRA